MLVEEANSTLSAAALSRGEPTEHAKQMKAADDQSKEHLKQSRTLQATVDRLVEMQERARVRSESREEELKGEVRDMRLALEGLTATIGKLAITRECSTCSEPLLSSVGGSIITINGEESTDRPTGPTPAEIGAGGPEPAVARRAEVGWPRLETNAKWRKPRRRQ